MRDCPEKEQIARLASGDMPKEDARRILEHIQSCEECRKIAGQFARLEYLLGCAATDEDGKVTLDLPGPDEDFEENLLEKIRGEIQQKRAREERLRPLLEDVFQEAYDLAPRPEVSGYAARRDEEGPTPREKMFQELVSLLDSILAPDMSTEERLQRIEKAREALGEPESETGPDQGQ